MKNTIILLSLSLITISCDSSSAEPKAKPSTSRKARPSAEKKLDGIIRSTDKDHDPTEPFHIARTPAEIKLDEIINRAIEDDNIFEYVLGRPWYDAKKDRGYSRLFTKEFLQALAKIESDTVKTDCAGKYIAGEICGIDYNPITCAQDYSNSGYLYRTVEDDGRKAKIMYIWTGSAIREIQTTYRLIKVGDDWKLDDVSCQGGSGFNKDCSNSVCAKDVPYIRQKAKAGDPDAQFTLGVMYTLSRGAERDYALAAKWFHKAGKQGHADAQYYLGYIYHHGQGVKMNKTESGKWYRKAAEQGHADAQSYLGYIYKHGDGVQHDNAESARWYRKAAEQGEVSAQFSLGEMYEIGQGVQQDIAEALKWYRKAANLGLSRARYRLGLMYELGQGVQQDDAEAVTWIRQAAERNYSDAQYHLGEIYKNGRGVKIDFAEAEKWFRKAADNGHSGATQEVENLGRR